MTASYKTSGFFYPQPPKITSIKQAQDIYHFLNF